MRLIDVDEASGIVRLECGQWVGLANTIIKEFYALKPVDAVPVVRCRDCKHNPLETWFDCPLSHLKYDGERWCWKGERKDGDNHD